MKAAYSKPLLEFEMFSTSQTSARDCADSIPKDNLTLNDPANCKWDLGGGVSVFVAGGACNSYTKWQLTYIDESKTQMKLTVSGNGIMPSYGTAGAPWYGYLDNIVEIEVSEGVTNIGRCAFYGLKFVTTVTLPETLTSIDAYAFNGCRNLKEIEIPASVTTIDPTAFGKTGVTL